MRGICARDMARLACVGARTSRSGKRETLHFRSPPASAGGFYSTVFPSSTVASPVTRSLGWKPGDTGWLGEPGKALQTGRCLHPESPGFRRGLLFNRPSVPSWRQDVEQWHTIGRLDGGPAQQPEAAQALVTNRHPPVVATGCRWFACIQNDRFSSAKVVRLS